MSTESGELTPELGEPESGSVPGQANVGPTGFGLDPELLEVAPSALGVGPPSEGSEPMLDFPPAKKQGSSWKAALVVALGVLAVLAFLPTTTVSYPGKLVPITEDGTLNMLTVYEENVPFLRQTACLANDSCFTLDSGASLEGFPKNMEESLRASALAAGALAEEPTPDSPKVTGVSGPSAGLIIGLGHMLDLTGSTLGKKVAATGTLSPSGQVGPVAGIQAKSQLAQDAGMEVLLVPPGASPLATGFSGQVIEVETLGEAFEKVCALPGSDCAK